LPLTGLHQHCSSPFYIFKLRMTAVKQNARQRSRIIDRLP
jgi:hypothetical protein